MKRNIIRITDSGAVTVPSKDIRMTIVEIADLFGIYYQTTKQYIRTIEESGVADGDYSMCCVVEGSKVYPEYYELEMIVAVAFRVQSTNAELFRKWLLEKAVRRDALNTPKVLILSVLNSCLN